VQGNGQNDPLIGFMEIITVLTLQEI